MTAYTVTVVGQPAPKGSLVPFIDRASGRARVKEDESSDAGRRLKSWRALVTSAGRDLAALADGQYAEGPVAIDVVFTIARPATINPSARPWPWKKSPGHGDVDKLARTVLDALTDSGLIDDDAQVVELTARKAYPDTPDCPGRLDRPGAVITIRKV